MKGVVREATASDLDAILEIQHVCDEAPQWSAAQYADSTGANHEASRHRRAFVAEKDGEILGYLVISVAAGEAELESVAVLPEARRRGLARALCETALAWAAATGTREVWLEVRSASTGPQTLYRLLGFVPMDVRPRYYAHPEDDAVLMRANLSGPGSEGSHL